MTEERIVESRDRDGATNTHTTIIEDRGGTRRGDGRVLVILLAILVVTLGVGVWLFGGLSEAEITKDEAVAGAANEVQNAAGAVEEVAREASEAIAD